MKFKDLVDVSDILYFFCSGEGKGGEGGVRGQEGKAFLFFFENPRRGLQEREGGRWGRERVCGEFWGGG